MGTVDMVNPHFQHLRLYLSISVFIILALVKLLTEEKKNASKAASLEEMLPKSSLHHMLSGSYSVKHRNNCFPWTHTLISSS